MLTLPQRRRFATRDDFAAAVSASFQELWALYENEAVLSSAPEWTEGNDVYNVRLPLAMARQGGDAHGISNVIKHAIETKKTEIERIARVERDGYWIVYFEAK